MEDDVLPKHALSCQGILKSFGHTDLAPLGTTQLVQKHGLVEYPKHGYLLHLACYLLIDLLHWNLQKQVHDHVPTKEVRSTDIQRASDTAIYMNQTEVWCMAEAKIRLLQKDLDTATWRMREMNQGWISTIEDGLDVAADLQKLVAENRVPNSADADVNEINVTVLEHVKARAEILRASLQADDLRRVI